MKIKNFYEKKLETLTNEISSLLYTLDTIEEEFCFGDVSEQEYEIAVSTFSTEMSEIVDTVLDMPCWTCADMAIEAMEVCGWRRALDIAGI